AVFNDVILLIVVHVYFCVMILFNFFSSRRRHTRWPRDWSSDVCSSDLALANELRNRHRLLSARIVHDEVQPEIHGGTRGPPFRRSEERRVGKELRFRSCLYM